MAWALPAFMEGCLTPLLSRLCAACSKRDNPERHLRACDASPGDRRNHCHSCDQFHQQHPGLHCSLSCETRHQCHQHPACLSVRWLCTCWTAGEWPGRSAGLHQHGCCDAVQQAGLLLHRLLRCAPRRFHLWHLPLCSARLPGLHSAIRAIRPSEPVIPAHWKHMLEEADQYNDPPLLAYHDASCSTTDMSAVTSSSLCQGTPPPPPAPQVPAGW